MVTTWCVDNRHVHFTLLFQIFVVWGQMSACRGATGISPYLTLHTPPIHSQRTASGSCVVCAPLDRYVGWHINRCSTNMSVVMSVKMCWSSIGRYVDQHIYQYISGYVNQCPTHMSVVIAADTWPRCWLLIIVRNIGRLSVVSWSTVLQYKSKV